MVTRVSTKYKTLYCKVIKIITTTVYT